MSNNSPVSFTDTARENLRSIIESGALSEPFVRVGMRGGACGGTYVLGFDQKTDFDDQYLIADIPVVIDKRQMLFVVGTEIDFDPGANGFHLHKPKTQV